MARSSKIKNTVQALPSHSIRNPEVVLQQRKTAINFFRPEKRNKHARVLASCQASHCSPHYNLSPQVGLGRDRKPRNTFFSSEINFRTINRLSKLKGFPRDYGLISFCSLVYCIVVMCNLVVCTKYTTLKQELCKLCFACLDLGS